MRDLLAACRDGTGRLEAVTDALVALKVDPAAGGNAAVRAAAAAGHVSVLELLLASETVDPAAGLGCSQQQRLGPAQEHGS